MPGIYDLEIYRGDTVRWRFNVWEDPTKTTPANLAGVEAAAQVRDRPAGSILATMTCLVTDYNVIDMTLPADQSSNLPASRNGWQGTWDLQLTYPSGDIITIVYGQAFVTTDVTNSTAVVA